MTGPAPDPFSDWIDQYSYADDDKLVRLPPWAQHVVAIHQLLLDIMNDGLASWFRNSPGKVAATAAALETVGLPDLAKSIRSTAWVAQALPPLAGLTRLERRIEEHWDEIYKAMEAYARHNGWLPSSRP